MTETSVRRDYAFSTVLANTLSVTFRRAWPALLISAAVSVLPPAVFVSMGLTPMQWGAVATDVDSARWELVAVIAVVSLTGALATLFVLSVTTRFAVAEIEGVGRWTEAVAETARRLLPLIGLSVLYVLGLVLAFLLLIVPGFLLMTVWYVVVPAFLMERLGVFAAFGRSAQLTKGRRWSLFGLIVLLGVVQLVFGTIAGVVALNLMQPMGLGVTKLQPLASALFNGLMGVLSSVASAAAYAELRRARGEGGDPRVVAAFD